MVQKLLLLCTIHSILISLSLSVTWNGYDPREIFENSEKVFEALLKMSTIDEEKRCLKNFKTFSTDLSFGNEWTERSKSHLY